LATALLRTWDEAAGDLHAASNIEYDDEISVVLKVDYRFTMYVISLCDCDFGYLAGGASCTQDGGAPLEVWQLWKQREEKKAEHHWLHRRAEAHICFSY
jgi:hypothetical protein